MVPDFALRIQSMIRSLDEVVLPAIPDDRKLALDQARIIVGNLRLMADQHDKIFRYELVELHEYARLVGNLVAAAQGGGATKAAVELANASLLETGPIVELNIPHQHELSAFVKSLKSVADALVRSAHEDGTIAFRQTAASLVMRQSQAQIARERRWFQAAGFELEPDALPTFDEVLR
jgi:hypothetical protein